MAGAAGLVAFAAWDVALAVTGPGLGDIAWWAGVGAGVAAAILWLRWARRPMSPSDRWWAPWQWVTALPLIALPFFTRTGDALPAALGYESVAYLSCLAVVVLRLRRRDAETRIPAPRPPVTMRRPANRD